MINIKLLWGELKLITMTDDFFTCVNKTRHKSSCIWPESSLENKPNLMMTYDDFFCVSEWGWYNQLIISVVAWWSLMSLDENLPVSLTVQYSIRNSNHSAGWLIINIHHF